MRYTSSDGIMSSSDPEGVALWNSIVAEQENDKRSWTEILRSAEIKLAHPDDGWVKRDRNRFSMSWYPQFDDRPEVGDLVAFGNPPEGEYYRSWQDVFPDRKREKDPYLRKKGKHYANSPEVACDGYRICKLTKVERRHSILGYIQDFEYEDTGIRFPPRKPDKKWWKRG